MNINEIDKMVLHRLYYLGYLYGARDVILDEPLNFDISTTELLENAEEFKHNLSCNLFEAINDGMSFRTPSDYMIKRYISETYKKHGESDER